MLDGKPQVLIVFEGIETITKKIWITENIYFFKPSNLASFFIPKIAVCDIKELTLEYQELSFAEFKFLTASGNITILYLSKTTITIGENDNPVYINDILKCVPNVVEFTHYNEQSSILPSNFVENFKEIDATKIKKISIDLFSYSCFEAFLKFVNHNPQIRYYLYLIRHTSEEETQALRSYIKEIIDASPTKFPPVYIGFQGQSPDEASLYYTLCDQYNELNNVE